jgi:hypothetical protein
VRCSDDTVPSNESTGFERSPSIGREKGRFETRLLGRRREPSPPNGEGSEDNALIRVGIGGDSIMDPGVCEGSGDGVTVLAGGTAIVEA